jgi:uncharacterized protein YhjY with autotransporter beta-barrel domain
MRRPLLCLLCVALGGPFLLIRANAEPLGDAVDNQGGSETLSNAGDAIQATCNVLRDAGGVNLQGARQDLFFRCNEMVTTYALGPPANPTANSYGYAAGAAGNTDRLNAVQQFTGEEAGGAHELEMETSNLQFNAIGARMDAIRQGIRTSGTSVVMNGIDTNTVPGAGWLPQTGGAAGDDGDTGWAWFVNANIGSQDHDLSPDTDGYEADYYGGTLGVDYALRNGAVVGFAFGYENYSTDIDSSGVPSPASPTSPSAGGGIDGDSYFGSVYGTYTYNEWYMSAIVSYGTADYDIERNAFFLPGATPSGRPAAPGFIINRRYDANTDSDQVGLEATLGTVVLQKGAFSVDGYVKLDYLSMYIDGYSEQEVDLSGSTTTPGLALTYLGQDISTAGAGLGATLRWDIGTSFGVVVPYLGEELRFRWIEADDLNYSYTNAIQHVNFASPLDSDDETYSVITAGVSAQFAHNISAFAQYEAFVGLNNVEGGVGTIGLRGSF